MVPPPSGAFSLPVLGEPIPTKSSHAFSDKSFTVDEDGRGLSSSLLGPEMSFDRSPAGSEREPQYLSIDFKVILSCIQEALEWTLETVKRRKPPRKHWSGSCWLEAQMEVSRQHVDHQA